MNKTPNIEIYVQATEQALGLFLASLTEAPKLLEAMKYSLFEGGKRIRPVLALASCEAVGGKMADALPVACALEMIHTYSLIHDDLPAMDDDDLRRGQPSNHKKFGEALAILAGDGLLTEAFRCLSQSKWNLPPNQKMDVIRIVAEGAGADGMVAGQALDIQNEDKDFEEKTIEKIHQNKTGKLLLASVLAGGRAGGAEGLVFQQLEEYGKNIGLAFQIADDILDLTRTTEELGKNSKSDVKKKKATYPSLLGIEASQKKAKMLLDRALEAIKPLGPKANLLSELAVYIVDRRS